MNTTLKYSVVTFLITGFVLITVGILIPGDSLIPIFSLYLLVVVGFQALGLTPAALVSGGFATLFGIFCMNRVEPLDIMGIPIIIITLFITVSIMYAHLQKRNFTLRNKKSEGEFLKDEIHKLSKEIIRSRERRENLLKRSQKRRTLVQVTREMGSLLDPSEIQDKLLEAARQLFPAGQAHISYGQASDAIDHYVVQNKKSVIVPVSQNNSHPVMAAPIKSQGDVAGILRVVGTQTPYNQEDLRLLEICASLASSALDNSILFNQVQETALRDGLTGLLTHRAFQDHLEAQILEASRFSQSMSVVLCDVDHFKSVNDTHGHQAGDQILQGVAHVIFRNVRDIDIVARYGGEEFVILLLQTAHRDALAVAEQIRQDMESQDFDTGKKSIRVTGSFGVSTFPEDATSGQQLVRKADQRLYQAKKSGRNRVVGL